DEKALVAALKAGTIASAGLDVFGDEPRVPKALIDMENVVLFPHVGSASVHTRNAMGNLVVDNLRSWFSGKGPLTPVHETPWPKGNWSPSQKWPASTPTSGVRKVKADNSPERYWRNSQNQARKVKPATQIV